VEQLAEWPIPSDVTAPAVGSSLKKAAEAVSALKETKWDIFETAEKLEGNQKAGAIALTKDLKTALESDEYAVALKPKLKTLEKNAFSLIKMALDENKEPVKPPVEPDPPIYIRPDPPLKPDPPVPTEFLVDEGEKDVGQKELKDTLNRIQKAVDQDNDVRIFLTWKIYKAGN
jgi:hypothetical protein